MQLGLKSHVAGRSIMKARRRSSRILSHHIVQGCIWAQVMGKNKVLVKVHPEGKYVVDIDKSIDIAKVIVGARVALKNDSYTLHFLLPTKVSTFRIHPPQDDEAVPGDNTQSMP